MSIGWPISCALASAAAITRRASLRLMDSTAPPQLGLAAARARGTAAYATRRSPGRPVPQPRNRRGQVPIDRPRLGLQPAPAGRPGASESSRANRWEITATTAGLEGVAPVASVAVTRLVR